MRTQCARWHVWRSRNLYLTRAYTRPLDIDYKVCERCGAISMGL